MISIVDPSVEEFERMGRGNVGTLRLLVQWPDVEPSPDEYDWEALDYYVATAAANGIEVFPFPYGTPSWAGVNCAGLDPETCERVPPLTEPARTAWTDFLQDFVGRYGPQGTFWSDPDDAYDPPYLPITEVQVWNEPSSQTYWRPKPKPKQYGSLVKISHDAIAAVDPSIQIVLAGVFPSPELGEQFRFTKFLEQLYDVKGIKRYFDAAAFHPYARTIKRLKNQIKTIRQLMRQGGVGSKPLWISELGWGSAPPFENRPLIKGIEGQRMMLDESFQLLEAMRSRWRLAGVIWYSFRDPGFELELCPFCSSSGLFDVNGEPKPSWFSYTQRTGGAAE
jgi:polysaccharide biosynthesis protein PslG